MREIENEDHTLIESYLPAVHSAVRRTYEVLGLTLPPACVREECPFYQNLFGHGQGLLVDEFRKGNITENRKMTGSYLWHHMPNWLLDFNSEDEVIRVPAKTNRTRKSRGQEPHRIEYEGLTEDTRASECYGGISREVDPLEQILLAEMFDSFLDTILSHCCEDELDRAIVKEFAGNFDIHTYRKSDRKSQATVASMFGISRSAVQRRMAKIWKRFEAIRQSM